MSFSESDIKYLRAEVSKRLSNKRFLHTLAVSEMAAELSVFCGIECKIEAEIAGLLHDVTKELPHEAQLSLLFENGISLDEEDEASPAVLHSYTAPLVIKRDFPDYATDKVLSSAKNHTLGSPDMILFDEIIFLADFIERTRTYPASHRVREFVFLNMKSGDFSQNINTLHKASVMAIDSTLTHLIEQNRIINSKNVLTRNALLSKIIY